MPHRALAGGVQISGVWSQVMNELKSRLRGLLKPWLLLPLLFGLVMVTFYPFRFVFEFDPDEGINVMKSFLQLQGFRLYADVYSDQPPAFTIFLTGLFSLFGANVTLARLGVLGFSLLLLGAAVQYLESEWGLENAIVGFLFLVLIPDFAQLSVSVMIGLPALALALLSFALVASWARSGSTWCLALSGLLMGAALLTKAIVAPLAPILAVTVLHKGVASDWEEPRGLSRLRPVLIWGGATFVLVLLAGLAIGPQNWRQLTASHFQSDAISHFISRAERKDINYYLGGAWGGVALGILGAAYAGWKRRWTALSLAGWGLVNYVLLTLIAPVWYHHQPLVTIPAAVLAALPAGDALATLVRGRADSAEPRRRVASLALLILAAWLYVRPNTGFSRSLRLGLPNAVRGEEPSLDFIHMARMSELRRQDDVIVTDRPMFAFRLRKIVPPNLAVWSRKRLEIGSITEEDVIAAIEAWSPGQVLIGRYVVPAVEDYLGEDYSLEYHYGDFRLYGRNPG